MQQEKENNENHDSCAVSFETQEKEGTVREFSLQVPYL
jgi:hypothetical protein